MPTVPCAIDDCDKPARGRGWCGAHYARWNQTGDPLTPFRVRRHKAPCAVDGCEEPARTRDWCMSHYQRWHRTGDPLPVPVDRLSLYWSRVDTSGGPGACWPWVYTRDKNGYGIFSTSARHFLAHRWGYEHRIGPIPEGHGILHRCDNPPCQNDRHWFTGTQVDNNADKMSKDRQRAAKGERQHSAKLTDALVREIRARYAAGGVSTFSLAPEYGVTQACISAVVRRATWKHIE